MSDIHMIHIREIKSSDKNEWLRLREKLWPNQKRWHFRKEMESMLRRRSKFGFFLAEQNKKVIGFIECSLKTKAPGCQTKKIGYVEGWYVEPESRKGGIGKKLVHHGELWAKERGCTEMASDTTTEYPNGKKAHEALGYKEVKRQFYFRKGL